MGKRKSLVRQGVEKLLSMAAYGQSKYQDKLKNNRKPAIDKIYSSRTMDNYIDVVSRFLRWAQKAHACRNLEETRQYVAEYLRARIATKSAWTVRMEAAAIAKLFQCSTTELGVELPTRHRKDITQHRDERWRGHFNPDKYPDLVSFAKSSGLRRHELEAVTPEDVYRSTDGQVYVFVRSGKGGKSRHAPCLNDQPLRVAQQALAQGRKVIFDHIPKYAPIHEYRAMYAQEMYRRNARNPEKLSPRERYICRGDMVGAAFDKAALSLTSQALGHARLSVVVDHYLYDTS